MRMITGAILMLAGVIPFCIGQMVEYADWFRNRDMPLTLEIGGGVLFVFGLGILI